MGDPISIPASHAGGDTTVTLQLCLDVISIPASHAGGDYLDL